MNGSASWQRLHSMPDPRPPWTPLHRFVDLSLSAGCGTWPPSVFVYSAFWKKHVFPVNGLCPIIAMSMNWFEGKPPMLLRHSSTHRGPLSFVRDGTGGAASHSE